MVNIYRRHSEIRRNNYADTFTDYIGQCTGHITVVHVLGSKMLIIASATGARAAELVLLITGKST